MAIGNRPVAPPLPQAPVGLAITWLAEKGSTPNIRALAQHAHKTGDSDTLFALRDALEELGDSASEYERTLLRNLDDQIGWLVVQASHQEAQGASDSVGSTTWNMSRSQRGLPDIIDTSMPAWEQSVRSQGYEPGGPYPPDSEVVARANQAYRQAQRDEYMRSLPDTAGGLNTVSRDPVGQEYSYRPRPEQYARRGDGSVDRDLIKRYSHQPQQGPPVAAQPELPSLPRPKSPTPIRPQVSPEQVQNFIHSSRIGPNRRDTPFLWHMHTDSADYGPKPGLYQNRAEDVHVLSQAARQGDPAALEALLDLLEEEGLFNPDYLAQGRADLRQNLYGLQ